MTPQPNPSTIRFGRILVPIDFEEASERAIDVAQTLAPKFDAHITLVHAFSFPPLPYGDGIVWPVADLEREAQKLLDAALARLKAKYPNASAVLTNGPAWQRILDVAKQENADVIVIGTHGRRGLERIFLGSVAERVVRASPIPVLTVSAAKR